MNISSAIKYRIVDDFLFFSQVPFSKNLYICTTKQICMGKAAVKYSIEEYLEMETNSLEKLEYHEGEIFAMAGGTLNHGLLSNNVGYSLNLKMLFWGNIVHIRNSKMSSN